MSENEERHPSYGIARLSVVRGGSTSLFMSDVPHNRRIKLEICRATKERDLNNDHVYADREPIIHVELSEHQFAQLISSMGTEGTPCTLRRIEGEGIEYPPPNDKEEVFKGELNDAREDFEEDIDELYSEAKNILSPDEGGGYLSKSDRKRILSLIESVRNNLYNQIPFLFDMLEENLEESVIGAKTEIEAKVGRMKEYLNRRAKELGLDEGATQRLLGDEEE